MVGHIKRKALQTSRELSKPQQISCPLCGRLIPKDQQDAHHLVPKSKGGRLTIILHRICHRQIHALLTERELAASYSTIDALLQHQELAQFVTWVKNKPENFYLKSKKSLRLRS
jgi:5-methylcytosine-specific restriction endonuclease McrA